MNHAIEIDDARLLLRWAADALNPTERAALNAFAHDIPDCDAAATVGLTRGALWMARQTALPKMRRRLVGVGICRVADVLS